jgi:hypothetical protein
MSTTWVDVVTGNASSVPTGAPGADGAAGPGVASDGAAGQVLVKDSAADYDTSWSVPPLVVGSHGKFSDGRNGIIIPYYLYPNNPYNDATVLALLTLIRRYPTVPVLVVINPGSGPGSGTDGNYTAFIRVLKAAGAKVCGYISTAYAVRAEAEVKADMDLWLSLYTAARIDGIFMDEQPYELTVGGVDTVALYARYTDYAHSLGLWPVIGNPGANQQGAHFATRTADIIIVNEVGTYPSESDMLGNFVGGHVDYPRTLRAALVYGQSSLDLAAFRTLCKYVQYVYVTHDALSPNPWDSVSTLLEQQMAVLFAGQGFVMPNALASAADDTAAAAAGVPIGALYRTGSAVKVRIA